VSKVIPEMSSSWLGFDARPSTVNTVPGVAPLIVKKSASMFPNTVLVPMAVPCGVPSVISACTKLPSMLPGRLLLLLKNNPTSKVLGTLPFTVKVKRDLNPDEAGAKAKPLFMSPPDGLSILRKPDAVWTPLKPDPATGESAVMYVGWTFNVVQGTVEGTVETVELKLNTSCPVAVDCCVGRVEVVPNIT